MFKPSPFVFRAIVIVGLLCAFASPVLAAEEKVKVFILAGQSNMVGTGEMTLNPKPNARERSLDYLVWSDPNYKHLLDKDGKWV